MRHILFLAAFLLLIGTVREAAAAETISSAAVINSCDSCNKCSDHKCGCEKPKCGCEKKSKCGCEKTKCGCEKQRKCGCEDRKDCGCISEQMDQGGGLAYSMLNAESMASRGLAYSLVRDGGALDGNCCEREEFCLLENCSDCFTLLCENGCGKRDCGCEKQSKCGCEKKSKCGCEQKSKCGCEQKSKCGCEKKSKCGCEQQSKCGCEKQAKCGCSAKSGCH